jgi:hypothetical protein
VQVGAAFALTDFQVVLTIPSSLVNAARSTGATSIQGTASALDVAATNATPASLNAAAPPIPYGPLALVENEPLAVRLPAAAASVGPWTASAAGVVSFTPGAIDVSVSGGTALHTTLTCTPTTTGAFATTTAN